MLATLFRIRYHKIFSTIAILWIFTTSCCKRSVLWIGLVLVVAGCASAPEQKPFVPPVFPSPPAEPRFYFEHSINSTGQVALKESRATRLRRIVTGERKNGLGLSKPFDVSVCKGAVFISDTVYGIVIALDFPGGRFFTIGEEEPGKLGKPLGVNTDAECNVYVADNRARQVMKYDSDGKFIAALGDPDEFSRLTHLAVDERNVYAVDTGGVESEQHRITVLDKNSGEHQFTIGTRGKGEGQLNLPRDIEVGKDGRLYVVDGANFRIQVFESDGTYVSSFGDIGRRSGQFVRPKGIAIDPSGMIYVTDASHGNFQIFDPEGQLLLFVGGRSMVNEPAKYLLPAGIDVDEDGRVYMVGQYFRKVDVYRPAHLATKSGFLGILAASQSKND